jgi:hypothetical protein
MSVSEVGCAVVTTSTMAPTVLTDSSVSMNGRVGKFRVNDPRTGSYAQFDVQGRENDSSFMDVMLDFQARMTSRQDDADADEESPDPALATVVCMYFNTTFDWNTIVVNMCIFERCFWGRTQGMHQMVLKGDPSQFTNIKLPEDLERHMRLALERFLRYLRDLSTSSNTFQSVHAKFVQITPAGVVHVVHMTVQVLRKSQGGFSLFGIRLGGHHTTELQADFRTLELGIYNKAKCLAES